MRDLPDREQTWNDAGSGTNPERTRGEWLATIEDEARLANEFGAFLAAPAAVVELRDDRQLRWERIAARVFGDARRTSEVRELYDESKGPHPSSRSYTGRGRRLLYLEKCQPASNINDAAVRREVSHALR